MTGEATAPLENSGATVRRMRAEVVVGPDAGKSCEALDQISMGSGDGNTLVLSDPTVSRFHAELVRENNRVAIVDLGSTNGVISGGLWVQRAWLSPGTVLTLGRTQVRFSDGGIEAPELFPEHELAGLIGKAPVFRSLMARLRRSAASDASVLILGETGAGKEVVARAMHELSARSDGPFETVDCGSVIPTLLASELFGHERGAFTGADRQHVGAFERAHGGTIFLDEIGELPPDLQTALLGALERRSFRRLGGRDRVEVDVRVLAATNRDLRAEVNAGTFRADLYYRLAVVSLVVPPLRERPEDIPLLTESFLRAAGYDGEVSDLIDDEAMEILKRHRWPGNVRELRNVVQAAMVMGELPEVEEAEADRVASIQATKGADDEDDAVFEAPFTVARATAIERFEARYLAHLLERSGGNVSRAARLSQINRSYLNRLLKRHNIQVERD